MAHRQHQIHLLPFGEIEADLEVRFPHTAQEIGPVRQGGVGLEVEGDDFFELGQQLPRPPTGRCTGHLELASNAVAKTGQGWQPIQLHGHRPGAESKNSHRLAAGRVAS